MAEKDTEKIELYKLYVGMSDNLGTKRNQSNTFFITLISGIFLGYSFILDKNILSEHKYIIQFIVGFLGTILCILWSINIYSYKTLSKAKFQVIHELEESLSFAPFTKEWQIIKKNYKNYKALSLTETIVPIIFLLAFFAILVNSIIIHY